MRILPTSKPRIFITMGDPAGIGPEIIAKSLASPKIKGLAVFFVVVGDENVIKNAFGPEREKELSVQRISLEEPGDIELAEGSLNILDPGPMLDNIRPGESTAEGARKALECIRVAASLLVEGDGHDAMVTAPVAKSSIAAIRPGFVGHTEYLQEIFAKDMVTMVLIGDSLKVVPVTRHIPVADITKTLTTDLIIKTTRNVIDSLQLVTGKSDARIGISALNPHGGEDGHIGREEIDIITPAIDALRVDYPNIEGPIPADVIFYRALAKKIDVVIAMYHDQCLAPFKMVDFDNGVNMTLGLGHIRTSPDHGTAFDIAGKGIASSGSMEQAIKLAAKGAIEQ